MPVSRFYKVIYYKDRKKEWRTRIKAPNGRIIFDSGESYKRIRSAMTAFKNFSVGNFKEEINRG